MSDRQREIDEYHDRQAQAFYAEANPCEACGRPAGDRFFNLKHQLWIGADCPCIIEAQLPVEFRCPQEYRILMAAKTVGEMCDTVKLHRDTCPVCTPELAEQARKAA